MNIPYFSHRFGNPKRCQLCYVEDDLFLCENCGKKLCRVCFTSHPKTLGEHCTENSIYSAVKGTCQNYSSDIMSDFVLMCKTLD